MILSALLQVRTQDLPVYYNEVSAAYVFKKEVYEKYKRRIGIKPHITEVSGVECVDIDYPEDFEIATLYAYIPPSHLHRQTLPILTLNSLCP